MLRGDGEEAGSGTMTVTVARRVLCITPYGLRYEDQEGREGYVDFRSANEGWRAYLIESRGLRPEEVVSRGVGYRDACAKPRYIEFFCEPHVRVDFAAPKLPWQRRKSMERFIQMHRSIGSAGWTTLDLS